MHQTYNQSQVTIDDVRQKLAISTFPPHDSQRFLIARDENIIN